MVVHLWMAVEQPLRNADFNQQDSSAAKIEIILLD
jgi:hypothetical protein